MGAKGAAGVVVIGGTGGLGQAVCRDFAQAGRKVAFTFRSSRETAASLQREMGCDSFGEIVDLVDPQSVAAFLSRAREKFGGIDTLVHAAGPDIAQPYVGDITVEQWRSTMSQDVDGFFTVAQAILPIFRAQKNGALIAVTTAATKHYPARDALSAVPKAAIEQLVVAIAKEEGRYNIRANCVAPGMIEAGLGARMLSRDYKPEVGEAFRKAVPLRRFGTAQEISAVVTFLASPGAAYVSGQVIVVDGGWAL